MYGVSQWIRNQNIFYNEKHWRAQFINFPCPTSRPSQKFSLIFIYFKFYFTPRLFIDKIVDKTLILLQYFYFILIMVNEFKCFSLVVHKYDLILLRVEKGRSVEQLLVTCVNSGVFLPMQENIFLKSFFSNIAFLV